MILECLMEGKILNWSFTFQESKLALEYMWYTNTNILRKLKEDKINSIKLTWIFNILSIIHIQEELKRKIHKLISIAIKVLLNEHTVWRIEGSRIAKSLLDKRRYDNNVALSSPDAGRDNIIIGKCIRVYQIKSTIRQSLVSIINFRVTEININDSF